MTTVDPARRSPLPDAPLPLRIALLALCMIGILAVAATVEIVKIGNRSSVYQDDLERSIEQRSLIRRVSTLLQEAEAAQRGYLLTNNQAYQTLFYAVRRETLVQLEGLPGNFPGEKEQLGRAKALVALARERLAGLTAGLAEGRVADQPAKPGGADRADLEIHAMEKIHTLTDRLISYEEEQIRTDSRSVDRQLTWSRSVIFVLLASIVLLVSGVLGAGVIYLTHRGRIEVQLRDAMRLAKTANQAKSDFLASMSHEIRTPLTSILGYAELLLDEKLSKQQRQFVERLQISSAGLLALVNDILDFSKIEAGEVTLEREPLSIKALIADVMSIVSPDSRKKGIRLVYEVDQALPDRVVGDALRLRQVLLNLLSNAVKFTERGSVALRVMRDGSSPAGEMIRFEVRDTGIGIAADVRDKLFRRFSQLDTSIQRRYGGTGLGLAISRRLVELMGGRIGVESDAGQGSTFWFSMPLAAAQDTGASIGTAIERAAEPAAGGRILLVEDSPQNQDLIRTVLTRAGHHVDLADDGEEALAAVARASYDLILMDMQMPRMDGLTATRRIRERDGSANSVPIIAMTANILPEHIREFREAGANDHVAKPFRPAALIETVNRWLTQGAARHDPSQAGIGDLAAHDRTVLEEARAFMGDQWITSCLARLKANTGLLCASETETQLDVTSMKRQAHQIIADAGQLGFAQLSQCCIELEQACTHEQNVDRALERARQAGQLAAKAIDGLLGTASGG